MPLETQLLDRAQRPRKIPWAWEDRMILTKFVLLDGGTVGGITEIEDRAALNWGYIGAGCRHVFNTLFGYSQIDTKKTIWVRPGQTYEEYRA